MTKSTTAAAAQEGGGGAAATPCIFYAAKSTQDRHASIPEQIEDCERMAHDNDWKVVGTFTDEGFSAYSGNRGPGLEDARAAGAAAAIEYGTTAMLVAQQSDRYARGAGDKPGAPQALVEIWHQLRRQDVYMRSAYDDGDLRDSASVANLGQRAHNDSNRRRCRAAPARGASGGRECGQHMPGCGSPHPRAGTGHAPRCVSTATSACTAGAGVQAAPHLPRRRDSPPCRRCGELRRGRRSKMVVTYPPSTLLGGRLAA